MSDNEACSICGRTKRQLFSGPYDDETFCSNGFYVSNPPEANLPCYRRAYEKLRREVAAVEERGREEVRRAMDGYWSDERVQVEIRQAEERGRRRGVEEAQLGTCRMYRHGAAEEIYGDGTRGALPHPKRDNCVEWVALAPRDSAPKCTCPSGVWSGHIDGCALRAPRDSAPARYCDEPHPDRPLRCGRFVKHDGPHTAFVPGFEDEQRAAVHWEDRK